MHKHVKKMFAFILNFISDWFVQDPSYISQNSKQKITIKVNLHANIFQLIKYYTMIIVINSKNFKIFYKCLHYYLR